MNEEKAVDQPFVDLEEAWDEAENEAIDEVLASEPDQPETPDETPPDTTGGDEPVAQTPEPDAEAGSGQPEEPAVETQEDAPPVGLPPAAREAWKDTPAAMKEAIAKREKDYATGIQRHAENAKRAQAMDAALQPYQQYFAMNGGQPAQQIGNLLQTASILQGGTPAQKAQTVAQLIGQFGVDISTLDNLLVGESPPQHVQQHDQVNQAVQQAIAPYQQQLTQLQQQQLYEQQQMEQKTQNEIQAFASDPKNEFYADVAGDMANAMDLATQRGESLSLEDAYRMACHLRPDIAAIMNARNSTQVVQNKQRAAVSVTGNPGSSMAPAEPDSIAAALNAAWDSATRV